MILHRDKFRPPISFRDVLHRCKLVSPHRARTDVPHHSGLDQIVQCTHGLFGWNCAIVSMNLKNVDIIRVEALK